MSDNTKNRGGRLVVASGSITMGRRLGALAVVNGTFQSKCGIADNAGAHKTAQGVPNQIKYQSK